MDAVTESQAATAARLSARQSLAGRIAANTRWAREPDRAACTKPARDAFAARFEAEVDPGGVLNPEDRRKRAANAKSAHFQRMALASAKARRKA